MSEEQAEERILPSRLFIELDEISPKQRKVFLSLLKDLGFAPEEVSELVIVLHRNKPEERADANDALAYEAPGAGGAETGSER